MWLLSSVRASDFLINMGCSHTTLGIAYRDILLLFLQDKSFWDHFYELRRAWHWSCPLERQCWWAWGA